ncbi:S8 family serine peptidase [Streptomyces sp. NPDC005236]|uniref:S8 family serine peptidase n=1 Tax=Streptomyces sp. NPDC005236 TaxID=3157028 RepID=UPI0033B6655F
MRDIDIDNPYYARQWHLHTGFEHVEVDVRSSMRCDEAWSRLAGFGDPLIVVAATDSGCNLDHPAFGGMGKFAGWGYFDGGELRTMGMPGSAAAKMYLPGAHHGTSMCALTSGVVGHSHPLGVAPGCRLLPIRLQTEANRARISEYAMHRILDYVSERADVLLVPWSKLPHFMLSKSVVDRIEELTSSGGRRGSGLVFVCAAGNSNCPIDIDADVAVPYEVVFGGDVQAEPLIKLSKTFRNVLASLPGVLHVSSISSLAQRCHYSCYGPGIDLCAPSSNSRAFRGDALRGLGLTTSTGDPEKPTNRFKGTSGAAALVAGVAALVLSANPGLSALEVCRILQSSASKDLSHTGYDLPPPTSPDAAWDHPLVPRCRRGSFDETGWSPWFGNGKVDALRAVTAAQTWQTTG